MKISKLAVTSLTAASLLFTSGCGTKSAQSDAKPTASASTTQVQTLTESKINANKQVCSQLQEGFNVIASGLADTITGYAPSEAMRDQMLTTFIRLDKKALEAAQEASFGKLASALLALIRLDAAVLQDLRTAQSQNRMPYRQTFESWKKGYELVLKGCKGSIATRP